MKDDPTPQPFLETEFDEAAPELSPDGRWIAYCSDETGRHDVYVQAVSGQGGRLQISIGGGLGPVWSPSGKEIYYRKGNEMMAVTIETDPFLSVISTETLFESDYFVPVAMPTYRSYDVDPNGRGFVMVQGIGREPHTQIHVVTNWIEELKRLVPVN
jgi:Tol biopolymer transport system component